MLVLPVKFNLGPQPPGLVYSRRPLSPEELKPLLPALDHLDDSQRTRLLRQLYCLEWHGQTDLKADDLQGRKKDAGPNKVDQAAGWLEKFLAEYAYPSEEVFVAGKVAGFTKDNLYKAKERLGKDKVGASPDGARKRWWWGLGDPKGWKRRPTPDSPATLPFPKSPNIPNSCQGTRTFSRLGDTNCYERNRQPRTTRGHFAIFPGPPGRGHRSLFTAADTLLPLLRARPLAPRVPRATLLMPGETETGSAGAQPDRGIARTTARRWRQAPGPGPRPGGFSPKAIGRRSYASQNATHILPRASPPIAGLTSAPSPTPAAGSCGRAR